MDLTKAYKALTDETVRENLRLYGNPDGKQDFKVGIALPPWVIESSNNIWVLGAYALLFGIGLPYLVGRWWFGSRSNTKDGVKSRTAETFFKGLTEDDSLMDVTTLYAKGWSVEADKSKATPAAETALREEVEKRLTNAGGPQAWKAFTKVSSYSAYTFLPMLTYVNTEYSRRQATRTRSSLCSLVTNGRHRL